MISWEQTLDYEKLTDQLIKSKEAKFRFNQWEKKQLVFFIIYQIFCPGYLMLSNIYFSFNQTALFDNENSTIKFGPDGYIDNLFNHGSNDNIRN